MRPHRRVEFVAATLVVTWQFLTLAVPAVLFRVVRPDEFAAAGIEWTAVSGVFNAALWVGVTLLPLAVGYRVVASQGIRPDHLGVALAGVGAVGVLAQQAVFVAISTVGPDLSAASVLGHYGSTVGLSCVAVLLGGFLATRLRSDVTPAPA